MAGSALKQRIEILEMAEAQGKPLKPEHLAELEAYRKQGLAKGSAVGGKPNDGERTAAFLGTRLEGALKDINSAAAIDPTATKPNMTAELSRSVFGEGKMGEAVANNMTPAQRQIIDQAQEDALDAALTLGTGAAYSKEQLAGYKKSYFPQIGDTPESVAAKTVRFNRLIEAARVKAGSAAGNIDEALGKSDARSSAPPEVAAGEALIPPKLNDDGKVAVAGGTANPLPGAGPNGTGTEVVGTGTAAGRVIDGAIDKAAGITPPDGKLRVNLNQGGDPRLKDPSFHAGLKALLDDPKATGDQIRAYWASHGGAPVDSSAKGAPTSSPRTGSGGIETTEAGLRGVLDTVSLGFGDEMQAAGDTLADGGTFKDNLLKQRATDSFDSDYHPIARTAGQVVGGLALPMGEARTAAALGRTGAAYGAAYGFGSADGNLLDRGKGAALGGIGGAVAGAALGAGGNALAARFNAALPRAPGNIEGVRTLAAADRLDIPVMPADVGGAMTRRATGGLAQGTFSSGPIVRGAQRTVEAANEAKDNIVRGVGMATEPALAGEAATRGAQTFIERTRGTGNGAYDRAERLAGGARVQPVAARQALDRNIAELSQVPGGAAGLADLQRLRGDLDGDVSVAGIRGMRTALRDDFLRQGLRGSDLERRVNQVVDAAGDDVVRSLNSQGRNAAARAYGVADRYWRNRLRVIDDVLAPVIGREGEKPGEAVIQSLNTAARGNAARLTTFVRSLPPEESSVVRATMINQIGRATSGAQNATGDAFSLASFGTNWDKITPGAKRALFDRDSIAALNDLAQVASGTKAAQRYANHSNTGGAVSVLSTLLTGGSSIPAEMITGRMLASPRLARWLARAPSQRPSAVQAYLGQLGQIASREPAISKEVLSLQQRLTDALGNSTQRAAADEKGDDAR